MAARAGDVAVTASDLVPVDRLAQRDRDERGRDEGGVDIEVPVPDDEPGPAPQPAAEPSDGLPRTGLEVAVLWAAGVALLAAGLALKALTRRPLHRGLAQPEG